MIALRARQAAGYNADESFTYYVDSGSGSDANPGTKASPFLTVTHALATASAGNSIGLKRGGLWRVSSTMNVTFAGCRIGAYGPGSPPILSGGAILSSWTNVPSTTPASSSLTNADFEIWSTGLPTGWTVVQTPITQSTSQHESGTSSCQVQTGTNIGKVLQAATVASSTAYALNFWHLEDTANKHVGVQVKCVAGGTTYYLSPSGTWQTTPSTWSVTSSQSWALFQIGFTTQPSTTSFSIQLQGFDGTAYNAYVDNVSLGPAAPGNVYSAPLASTPSLVSQTTGGSTTLLGLPVGGAPTGSNAPPSGAWDYGSGNLYVNLGGTDPGTVTIEAAISPQVLSVNAAGFVARQIEVRYGADNAWHLLDSGAFTIDRCAWRYCGYQANSGAFAFYSLSATPAGGGRITRCVLASLSNDGIWSHNWPNTTIDYNTITGIAAATNDVQSDGIQIENTFINPAGYGNSNGLWIHHNVITVTANSIKGCLLVNARFTGTASGIVEYNTVTGGNYGIGQHASDLIVRHNKCLSQSSTFGGGIHIAAPGNDTLANLTTTYNLIVSPDGQGNANGGNGIIIQNGSLARTGCVIQHNTIVNPYGSGIAIKSPFGGSIFDNIIWWTSSAPAFACFQLYCNAADAAGPLAVDHNLYASAGLGASGFRSLATSGLAASYTAYATFASYEAGAGFDTHALSGQDPLFNADYTLQSGSPAIGAASDGGNIGAF